MASFPSAARVVAGAFILATPLAVLPSIASAASIERTGTSFLYQADAGEANDLVVQWTGKTLVFRDAGAATIRAADCSVSGTVAKCVVSTTPTLQIRTGDGDDRIENASTLDLRMDSGAGNDRLLGGTAAEIMNGGGDNDILRGRGGADALSGGAGIDTVSYDTSTEAEDIDPGGTGDDGSADDGPIGSRDTISTDVENLTGGRGDDRIGGSSAANFLSGGEGNDTLAAGAGNDDLIGEGGDDLLIGGTGADRFSGGAGGDTASYVGATEGKTASIGGTGDDGSAEDGPVGQRDTVRSDVENITGGNGNDTLTGDGGANVLSGGPGDDVLSGGAGPDALRGQDGIDRVTYAGSTEGEWVRLTGGVGEDGSEDDGPMFGRDTVDDDVENVTGGSGSDTLVGTPGVNRIDGGPGNDDIDGGAGADDLYGGAGDGDVVSYEWHTQGVTASLDNTRNDGSAEDGPEDARDFIHGDVEHLYGSQGGDSLSGNENSNQILGLGGDDVIDGRGGNDAEDGGAGRDVFFQGYGENGADSLNGGDGDEDTAYYIARSQPVAINLAWSTSGNDPDRDGIGDEGDRLQRIEVAYGGTAADRLSGGDSAETFFGNDGNDRIEAAGGDDKIMAGNGDDTILAGAGNDTIDAGYGADDQYAGAGDDTFMATSCAVICGDNNDRGDQMRGEEGVDTLDYQYRVVGVRVDVGGYDSGEDADHNGDSEEDDRVETVERIFGTDDKDWIRGSLGDDTIDGRGGDDTLDGGNGNDTVSGGDGNDRVDGGIHSDTISGGNGDDTLFQGYYNDGADDIHGDGGTDLVTYAGRSQNVWVSPNDSPGDGENGEGDNVHADVENLEGGSGNDSLWGSNDRNRIWGASGQDTIYGGGGDDELHGAAGIDFIHGDDGQDQLLGEGDGDYLYGDDGNDELRGGDFDDSLTGGMGNDALYGESGDDYLNEDNHANGADLISCGSGGEDSTVGNVDDRVSYNGGNIYDGRTVAIYINQDGLANDGQDADFNKNGEEGDNVMPDCASVWGGNGNDFFEGTSGPDRYVGMLGNDGFRTNGGYDVLEGREGDDVFLAKDGQKQSLVGGDGTDTAQYDPFIDGLVSIP